MSNPYNIPKEFLEEFIQFGKELPGLSGSSVKYCPQSQFLGPKAENQALFSELINSAFKAHIDSRKNFRKEDSPIFNPDFQLTPDYQNAAKDMKEKSERLFKFLTKSLPYSSFRYIGHMTSDVTIASVVGYISTILYNPNNVTIQASPVTTYIELAVGIDLCRMVGFPFPKPLDPVLTETEKARLSIDQITPRGHLTSGGTVANDEAMWSVYWAKFLPLALNEAIKYQPKLAKAVDLTVKLANGTIKKLSQCSTWEALNLSVDDCAGLPYRVGIICNIEPSEITYLLKQYHPSNLGILTFFTQHNIREPCFLTPATGHYSIPKAGALLGLGSDAVKILPVDKHGRMEMTVLRAHLEACLLHKIPVIGAVGVLGTTEESGVDHIDEIISIRDEFRKKGLNFAVHVDAAWGGYFLSMIRPDYLLEDPIADVFHPTTTKTPPSPFNNMDESDPALYCSDYFKKQLHACSRADTITIDPHKSGYIPYPAGAICYRNSRLRDSLVYTGVYIGGTGVTSVGIYGVEGSKPGAAACAVYLSHSVIRTSKSGYGTLLKRCMLNTRLFYLRLIWMCSPTDNFVVHGVPVPPSALQLEYFKKNLILPNGQFKSSEEISKNKELIKQLAEIGPDQNIICYAFNPKIKGVVNTDYKVFCDFNDKIYKRFDYIPEPDLKEYDLVISNTEFGPSYGNTFINSFAKRIGLKNLPYEGSIPVLRSTIMDVMANESVTGSAFDELIKILKTEVTKFSAELQPRESA
ncbi:pyridoxal phosphate-dependent decarboxylase family protein [Cavenderia fasciculata]|uniref:Pyridoxal phosphate-dependent decarboxylase family protein n=1 Tax=Cavenderia fasciculata TaxID=261658 RepID=F4QBJ5_CACFS|nr:pyridoxal phosphate-dependent decarboxylase family protein [Cavenderia fasciculata]EGG14967.1 pyridoxal phosphate-dependent decarboxylase family protein [Cavenderia fasciculata]|eukprot:XP_004351483.1 pyridoxal phosphate-dependent decarboxylase family protein [Cavenderia fasciculata]